MIKADEFLFRIGKDDKTWKMIIDRLKYKDEMTIQKIKKTVNTVVKQNPHNNDNIMTKKPKSPPPELVDLLGPTKETIEINI